MSEYIEGLTIYKVAQRKEFAIFGCSEAILEFSHAGRKLLDHHPTDARPATAAGAVVPSALYDVRFFTRFL